MTYGISNDIIIKTEKCKQNFECLNGNLSHCHCTPIEQSTESLLLLNKDQKQNVTCDYYVKYGHHPVCSCPVRKELHKKYTL